VCLALAYEKTGTLLVPMIMHAVFNAVSIAGIMFLL
jgi:membrane protease YdiL (CAAX protease family)